MGRLNEVKLVELPTITDERGSLTAIEEYKDVPFAIKRIFYVHHVLKDRGGHAHLDTDQVITCVNGKLIVNLSDAYESKSFELNSSQNVGLYVPKMIFCELKNFGPDSVCLVFASTHYDIKRSVRTWEEYLNAVKGM